MHIDVLVASHDVEGDRHGARDPWAPARRQSYVIFRAFFQLTICF
jgi:hypothetical protein